MTTRRPSTTGPSVTYLGRATFSPSTTSTNLRTCSVPMATSGTSSASAGAAAATWMRPNMPGVSVPSGLGNTARPRMVPELRSMALSTKSILPSCENVGSSISFSLTGMLAPRVAAIAVSPARRM